MSDISKARVKGVVYDIKDAISRSLVEQHELAIQEILENYARMDGYYETMGVGVATNLKGSNTSVAKFVYRKSGGSESVDSGLAQLTSMRGKSVVWNQQYVNTRKSGDSFAGITFYPIDKFSFYYSGTATTTQNITQQEKTIIGHKYYYGCSNALEGITIGLENIQATHAIRTASSSSMSTGIIFAKDKTYSNAVIFKPIFIDLTEMFGAGNEPSTVEEFEAMFPDEYYPYNIGSLLNFNAERLKTVGFNQWDEVCNFGVSSFVSANYIPVLPNTDYCVSIKRGAGYGHPDIIFYDSRFNNISTIYATEVLTKGLKVFTTPSNCRYIKFSGWNTAVYGFSSYNHDICINLSDPAKNGTYEPYWESYLPLNINTQTGKLNGSGDSIVVFPDGMAGMNGVQDTIIGNIATKKFTQISGLNTMGIVLNYEGYEEEEGEGNLRYSFNVRLPKKGKNFTLNALFSSVYEVSNNIDYNSSNNFCIKEDSNGGYIEIMDDNFAEDARFADEEQWDDLIADIRTSLADKMLLYELSVQEEYILDEIELPLNYKVDKNGTEQIIPNTSDPDNNIPSTTPCDMDIVYSIDAANTIINLPKNYVSATQQQSFSASQQAQARANIGLSSVATKYKTTIQGDGNNEYTITHNLSSTSVFVVVQDASTLEQISGYQVIADSANQITIGFNEEIGVGVTYNILILS